ncbi:MAG: prepilin-type N-terminal cleavage/methylation domain-containing protein [Kiritimatiellae bacterium]|nr:prepilin-type N-terminal cleavage/methylation domain-containing protein [Kiritimatiellia bacterium]
MHRAKAAFTLIELLLVVAILGILTVVAAPRVGAMLSGGALRTCAREIAGAGRYARTMALMNQTPVDLSIDLDTCTMRVTARERDSASWLGMSDLEAATNDVGYTDALLRTSARRQVSLGSGFGLAVSHNDADSGTATNLYDRLAATGDGSEAEYTAATMSFADSINVERAFSGVKVSFGGWRDVATTRGRSSARRASEIAASENGEAAVRYRANGTVRPHRWIVADPEHPSDCLFIDVNATGRVKIGEGN